MFYEMSITGDLVNATAFKVTDTPLNMAGEETIRGPYINATPSMVTNGNITHDKVPNSQKQLLNLAAWNVPITNDSDSSIR